MVEVTLSAPAAYTAALEGAAVLDEATCGRILMRGGSAADLLHRLSTNDILKLKPGRGARTVLTTPIGRIIDLLYVYARQDSLLIVTSPGQGAAVFGHLRKNIFFNDKVTLEPAGRSHDQLALYGPAAIGVLEQLTGVELAEIPPLGTTDARMGGAEILVARHLPIGGGGFRLLVPVEHALPVRAALTDAGVVPLDPATFDVLRVEQGYGAFGRELGQEYIPLETGLLDAVSFTKGCYVGQEIIARMESRNRLAKQLRGLKLSKTLEIGSTAEAQSPLAKLDVGGKEMGDLTSAVVSPRFGPIGLAYVRTAHSELGGVVGVAGSEATGEVVGLPFA